ncbi:amino acid permease [Sphingomonas jatrophae]|uniref:Amino acid/polyamine/organocation transporter, APC superfamily n=1 Tax=Sphingomonas jatrophae TaxID=1166337 RepID=A0A1I6JQV0_9SPHN|nr:amino acid permease [Sphingomonas jatrophae]SFR81336.1 amino acid/polyamine/organocation transporter, APC superfamily [Sphingomonas jatrophae]
MIFGRVKSLDAILATAEKKGLHRSLGAFQLTMLGIGAVIGTGIFVLTSEAAQKAGPAMMLSFVLAGFVCAVAALCYSELASMVPVAGSAYTYTYAVMGELLAWMVGWALVLEYAIGASAVAVGWSGYLVGLLDNSLGIHIPDALANGPSAGGIVNLPAIVIAGLVTWLLVVGTTESARVNAALVVIKVAALTLFVALSIPVIRMDHFQPLFPTGIGGMAGAAASIFFAYVGFDAVSTAAEETRDPQRNVPIGLIGSLVFCTIFYLLVAAGAIGATDNVAFAQPVRDAAGTLLAPGTSQLTARCAELAGIGQEPLSCSREALAHVLRENGWVKVGNLIGLAAFLALPSVVLMMMFGQIRVFFAMARDGLLPAKLASIHPRFRTPHVMTIVTGLVVMLAAAFLPVGRLADVSNGGTLFAFAMVAASVMVLRRTDPTRHRPFRTPAVYVVGTLAVVGCVYLYYSLPMMAKVFPLIWGAGGLLIYFLYSRSRSHVGRGIVDVVDDPSMQPETSRPLH